jgi:hypothetical protein
MFGVNDIRRDRFLNGGMKNRGGGVGYSKSLTTFHSKRALSWRFHAAGNNKTYLVLHLKCPIL